MVSQDTIIHLLPFTNKFALLLSDIVEPFIGFRFYYHHPHSPKQELMNLVIKFISLLGINLNVIQSTLDGGYMLGVAVSIIYFIFSYLVPNIFMDDLYKVFDFAGVNSSKIRGFIFGVIIIIILDIIIIKLTEIYKKKLAENKKNEIKINNIKNI